jgi:hypothetical protein
MIRRARDTQPEPLLQHLVVPHRFVVRVKQHVRMSLDEAGQERCARHLDDERVG